MSMSLNCFIHFTRICNCPRDMQLVRDMYGWGTAADIGLTLYKCHLQMFCVCLDTGTRFDTMSINTIALKSLPGVNLHTAN